MTTNDDKELIAQATRVIGKTLCPQLPDILTQPLVREAQREADAVRQKLDGVFAGDITLNRIATETGFRFETVCKTVAEFGGNIDAAEVFLVRCRQCAMNPLEILKERNIRD